MVALVGHPLEMLAHDHCLEQFPAKRMGGQLRVVGYAEKVASQSNIQEIEFWRLDKSLVNIRTPRLEHSHNITRFEMRQPIRRDLWGDAGVIR